MVLSSIFSVSSCHFNKYVMSVFSSGGGLPWKEEGGGPD